MTVVKANNLRPCYQIHYNGKPTDHYIITDTQPSDHIQQIIDWFPPDALKGVTITFTSEKSRSPDPEKTLLIDKAYDKSTSSSVSTKKSFNPLNSSYGGKPF